MIFTRNQQLKEQQMAEVMTDERAIIEVGMRYAHSIDTRNQEGFMSCFTADAAFGLPKLRTQAVLDQTLQFLTELFSGTQHVTTQFHVEVSGDEASMHSYYIATHVWRQQLSDPLFVMGGFYEDSLIRTPDGWRIRDRLLKNVWVTGDRDAIAAAGMGELLE
nr:nuclear transport factor 2 family protein [Rhodococcus wratislaviensis]